MPAALPLQIQHLDTRIKRNLSRSSCKSLRGNLDPMPMTDIEVGRLPVILDGGMMTIELPLGIGVHRKDMLATLLALALALPRLHVGAIIDGSIISYCNIFLTISTQKDRVLDHLIRMHMGLRSRNIRNESRCIGWWFCIAC